MFRNQFLQQKPTIIRKKRDLPWSSIKVYQSPIVSRKKPNFGCGWWYRTSGRGEGDRMMILNFGVLRTGGLARFSSSPAVHFPLKRCC